MTTGVVIITGVEVTVKNINIFVRMYRFLLTLDTIDILCLVYPNISANEIIFKFHNNLLLIDF